MTTATKTKQSQEAILLDEKKISSISQIRKGIKIKVKEDLFRFRTCCADPRASK